jgi:hypothetical protein
MYYAPGIYNAKIEYNGSQQMNFTSRRAGKIDDPFTLRFSNIDIKTDTINIAYTLQPQLLGMDLSAFSLDSDGILS